MKDLRKLFKKLPLTIELKEDSLRIINQTLLPEKLKFLKLKKYSQVIKAIAMMQIRGAEAIGAAGAGGIFLASLEYQKDNAKGMLKFLKRVGQKIVKTRPTAVNLAWFVNEILKDLKSSSVKKLRTEIYQRCQNLFCSEMEDNLKLGKYGNDLIKNNVRILTHCNAGSLSSIWFGTATAPIYMAYLTGKKIKVFIDETRPWLQGSRLTAWEMSRVGIDYQIVVDSAAGYLISKKMVDLVMVGADRIAGNGDTANKIGTYPLALMANECQIPFYVAADTASIDFGLATGQEIKIEERGSAEVLKDLLFHRRSVSPKKAKAFNPVFDITPAKYISAFITEKGIFSSDKLFLLKNKKNDS